MTERIGVTLCGALLVLFSLAAGCGDDKTDGSDASGASGEQDAGESEACDLDHLPKVPGTLLEYPDAYCGKAGCKTGGCDPLGRCEPACNAWSFAGDLSFQAVTVRDQGTVGEPPAPSSKDDEDPCPGKMVTPKGTGVNCCQRADNRETDTPALRMTSLAYTRPTWFGSSPVASATSAAFESDQYNMVSLLSSGEDGELTVTSGSALPNKDGSFTPIHGAFTSGSTTLNKNGAWDALTSVPSKLSTKDGVRTWHFGPTPPEQDYVVIMWIDNTYEFARMELHLREVQWTVPLDEALACAGEREIGQFQRVGKASGYVPLKAAINTEIWFTRDSSLNLCESMSGAQDCRLPVAKWRAP